MPPKLPADLFATRFTISLQEFGRPGGCRRFTDARDDSIGVLSLFCATIQTMHYVTTALAVIALVAIVIFATQNLQIVEVDFLFWSLKLSKFLIIIGAHVMGMLTGWGWWSWLNVAYKPNNRRQTVPGMCGIRQFSRGFRRLRTQKTRTKGPSDGSRHAARFIWSCRHASILCVCRAAGQHGFPTLHVCDVFRWQRRSAPLRATAQGVAEAAEELRLIGSCGKVIDAEKKALDDFDRVLT